MMLIDEFAPAFIDIPDAAMRLNIVKVTFYSVFILHDTCCVCVSHIVRPIH